MESGAKIAVWIALSAVACGGNNAHSVSGSSPVMPGGDQPVDAGSSALSVDGGGSRFAWDECGLKTGYAGDDRCILPPPAGQGFQLHYGPSDYSNPEPEYLLQPGDERTTDFPVTAPNDQDIFFYYRQYRLRPSAHHIILTTPNGATTSTLQGRRVGTANTSQDFPVGGIIPPEDEDVGLPLSAHATVSASFHAINTTDVPQLREAWINFWYRDPSVVKEAATEWFKMGSVTFSVPPNATTTLGPYTCSVQGSGHLLWLYGHRHANNTRFTVSRVRGAQTDVIYDANRWEEPILLEYDSLTKNPAPNIPNGIEGGWNGVLDLAPGDTIKWSCDVKNTHDTPLGFTEQTLLGEMCIVDAEAVGATCAGL